MDTDISAEWEKAKGETCPVCGTETLCLMLTEGVKSCPRCSRKIEGRTDQEIEMKSLIRSLRGLRSKNRK
jgi:ribosomal protein L37AE/L43A